MIRITHLLVSTGGDDDLAAYLSGIWLPMLRALPGVRRVEGAVVSGRSLGELKVRAVADAYFDDEHAMDAAFASAEGRRLSREILAGRGSSMEMLTLDVLPVDAPAADDAGREGES